MLLCSVRIRGEESSRRGVNNTDTGDWVEKQALFILGKGKTLYILQPPGEREQELRSQVIIVTVSDWPRPSFLNTQLQLLGPLGRPRLAHGEVNIVQAHVFMPRHVQTPFV